MLKTNRKKRFFDYLNMVLFGLVLCVTSFNAWAQPATSCDPELLQAMQARAWMETDREMVQMENLMTKPDSVLEYSCYDQMVSLTGEFPADIFSDDETKWLLSTGGLPSISNISTDIALQEVVGIALFKYLFANFGHRYLGDRTPVLPAGPPRAVRTYVCGALDYVWEKAKCIDFGEFQDSYSPGRTDFDMFYDFYWYDANDPRDLPTGMACTGSSLWTNAINTAFNQGATSTGPAEARLASRYVLPVGNEGLFTVSAYFIESVVPSTTYSSAGMYVEYLVEQSHGLFNQCYTIPTGITVTRTAGVSYSSATYQDATCPNPQCFFDQSQCQP